MIRYEYRVSWRRASWRGQKWNARLFETEAAAERFTRQRLRGDGRPELSALTVRIERREVGDWRDA